MPVPEQLERVTETLARASSSTASSPAATKPARAAGDGELLDALVARRLTGEPLAWITGFAPFDGGWIGVDRGVYVPRWQSERVARRAADRLPSQGTAIDVCTGAGAIARALLRRHPNARVLATDVDERAVACARGNGVEALQGDLLDPVPAELHGRVDVVAGVVPYVPTPELPYLQRDTFAFETPRSYDGGPDGLAVVRRVLQDARGWLRPGGAVVLELGGDQAEALRPELDALGYADVRVVADDDGDVHGIEATLTRA